VNSCAKQFIKGIGNAAKAGLEGATKVADTLVDASKLMAKAGNLPALVAAHVPVLRDIEKALNPLDAWQDLAHALRRGDFRAVQEIAKNQLSRQRGAEVAKAGRMFFEAVFGDASTFFRETEAELQRELEQRRAIDVDGHEVLGDPADAPHPKRPGRP
jgi:hypothetical protein